MMNRILIILVVAMLHATLISAQKRPEIPDVYSNLHYDKKGKLYFEIGGKKLYQREASSFLSLEQLQGNPRGTKKGIQFDFGDKTLQGTLYFGFIPYGDSRHPHPVYFRTPAPITDGSASIDIKKTLSGKYDMIGWEKNEKGTIGYRVVNNWGEMLYDGIVTFSGKGPFTIAPTLIEGPFVNLLSHEGATISFTTNMNTTPVIKIGDREYRGAEGQQHAINVSGLEASTHYEYTIHYGDNEQSYAFSTAPDPGSRSAFTFAYASDSRSGRGGGERNMNGPNFYIMKKIMALAKYKEIAFFQFSGDLIDGYKSSPVLTEVEYANWKRAVQPFGAYFPVYVSIGNHEVINLQFGSGAESTWIDRFPFESESSEAIFASNFVLPENGPESEDGASYDPNADKTDFPSYKESVFYYTYDNVAMVVLNSDYFYAPTSTRIPKSSGGLHAYIMDQQLEWFRNTMETLEQDSNIDHVFVTQHTPFFPNGGHVKDDMWYGGDNSYRPYVNGKPVAKGIIERRDELLDIIVNQSTKAIAILTGDEHNYARTEISPDMERYPGYYQPEKITLSRTIYQINNGAAGAPYYAQEQTPWSDKVSGFTTQNALVFFHVEGKSIRMEVLNPDTLEPVDELVLR